MKKQKIKKNNSGYIFDLQPYSVHDGPGIRTLIFLKGCPLNCSWCSNPEGISLKPQILFRKELCPKWCDKCISSCKKKAIKKQNNKIKIDFISCKTCKDFSCVSVCPSGALKVSGREITTNNLINTVLKDSHFFGEDGGITLSGGEPFSQTEFIISILQKCKNSGISTAIETSLYTSFDNIEKALPFIDFFMFDIKFIDRKRHRKFCRVENEIILENIRNITKIGEIPLLPRMPVIPGINNDQENLKETAYFLKSTGFNYINLVPYMKLGISKYEQLGKTYKLESVRTPTEKDLRNVVDYFDKIGINCL